MCTHKSLKTNTIARACKASAYFALGQTVVLNQNKVYYKCFFQRFSTAKKLKARQAVVTFFALNYMFSETKFLLSCIVLPENGITLSQSK